MSEHSDRASVAERVAGRRVVLAVYLAVVAIAGLLGTLLGVVNPEGLDPELFFLVDLPPTPLGMAVFGITTVGVGLGVLLFAVQYVSRFDESRLG